jgi:hypothetical protein
MSYERYKCDRNGGARMGRYMRRKIWWCPSCGDSENFAGHRCQDCRRRVCCSCFDHADGNCIEPGPPHPHETCTAAKARKRLNPGGGGAALDGTEGK